MKIIHKIIFSLSFNGVVWETGGKVGKKDTNNGSEKVHDSILIWTATRRCARSLRWCRQTTTKRPLYWRNNIFDHHHNNIFRLKCLVQTLKDSRKEETMNRENTSKADEKVCLQYYKHCTFFDTAFHISPTVFFSTFVEGKIAYSNESFTSLPLYFIIVFVCIYQWFKLP